MKAESPNVKVPLKVTLFEHQEKALLFILKSFGIEIPTDDMEQKG